LTEVERKGVGKSEVGLLISGVIIVILAISSLWLYTRIDSLQNQVNALETDKNNLQTQVNNLETDKTNLQNQVDNLQIQKDTLQNQLNLLNATYQNYVSTHSHSNSEYENYVSTHSHSNSEYDSLQSEYDSYVANHQYTNSQYDEAFFSFYYVAPEEQKFGVYDLEDELYGLYWLHPYEENVFDCSEMSAYLEWHLENEGWHAMIVAGEAPWDGGGHAWLLVETSEGQYMPVESTTIEIVWWEDPYFDNYFVYDYMFETIQEAVDLNESEFDWWNSP
jgi:hypothetical protein